MANICVTVIVPIYNVKQYVTECLESLERQTLENIEVLLINDGSTDGSDEIAKDFADKSDNFTLINRENGGLSAARNTGLDVATGQYVYFLDSDDFLADDTIEKLYNKEKEENLDQLRFVVYTFEDGTKDFKWTRDDANGGYKYVADYPLVMNGIDFYKRHQIAMIIIQAVVSYSQKEKLQRKIIFASMKEYFMKTIFSIFSLRLYVTEWRFCMNLSITEE